MKLPELPPDTAPAIREAFEVLARESAALRAELDALKSAATPRAASAAAPATPRPASTTGAPAPPPRPEQRVEPVLRVDTLPPIAPPVRPRTTIDMEKLIGRYGAWAAAALMILLGVGTLLEWAIRNGMFGPGARVALSVALAIALAVGGLVLRRRADAAGESRGFANACLGLALGVLDVIAWQTGPHWHMVPTSIALLLADIGAAALVSFGMREEDELLAAVGAAGLYLAPFVTSSGDGSPLILASYIALVSLALFRFVEQDGWRVARAVIRSGSLLSVLALMAMGEPVLGAIVASVLALATLRVDVSVGARLRMASIYVAAAIIATFAASLGTHAAWSAALTIDQHTGWLASVALLVTLVATSAYVLRASRDEGSASALWHSTGNAPPGRTALSLTITLLLPVAALLAAAAALPGDTAMNAVVLDTVAGLIALGVALRSDAPLATAYYSTGFVLLWVGALSYSSSGVHLSEAMLLGVTLVALAIASARPNVGVARFTAFASAACVAAVSAARMYTAESQVAPRGWIDVVLMAGAFVALAAIAREHVDGERDEARAVRMVAPWIAGLLLARHLVVLASGSYTAVALTTFYAATGLALIVLGRRRGSLALRRGGLGLSLYAPLRAIATATDVENTGVRVSVYFVAGAFMLLVAFLYRARGEGEAQPILSDVVS